MSESTRTRTSHTRSALRGSPWVLAGALLVSGCGASQELTRQDFEKLEQRVSRVETQAESNASRLEKIETMSRDVTSRLDGVDLTRLEQAGVGAQALDVFGEMSIYFDFDSADLRDEEIKKLDHLAAMLDARRAGVVTVRGYTDSRGDSDYNVRLSRERAEAVSRYVASRTHNKAVAVTILGLGELDAKSDNLSEAGHARNRRVEVVVLAPVEPGEEHASSR